MRDHAKVGFAVDQHAQTFEHDLVIVCEHHVDLRARRRR
jgi:hypothetical protein